MYRLFDVIQKLVHEQNWRSEWHNWILLEVLQKLNPGILLSAEGLKNDLDDLDWQTARHVAGGFGRSLSWRWSQLDTLLDTIKNMAGDKAQDEDKLADKSQTDEETNTGHWLLQRSEEMEQEKWKKMLNWSLVAVSEKKLKQKIERDENSGRKGAWMADIHENEMKWITWETIHRRNFFRG